MFVFGGFQMKLSKKILSILLCVVMVLGTVAMGRNGFAEALGDMLDAFSVKASAADSIEPGDIIEFGSYPQTKVNDVSLIAALGEQPTDSLGICELNGETYRKRISNSTTSFYKNEPIKWRVLSVGIDGIFLLSDKVIDKTYYADKTSCTWENSNVRSWIKKNIYDIAFSENEKKYIRKSHLINDGKFTGPNTDDYVFILSSYDLNSSYSLNTNELRIAKSTDYSNSNTWLLRTRKTERYVGGVMGGGDVYDNSSYHLLIGTSNVYGVRPAIKLYSGTSVNVVKKHSEYQFKVVDSTTQAPIANTDVSVNGVSFLTDTNGCISIDTGDSDEMETEISFSYPNYKTETKYLYELNAYGLNTISLSMDYGISGMLSDICLTGEDICGPGVDILGQHFSFFSFENKLEIPLAGVSINTKLDKKSHTLKATLGLKGGYTVSNDDEKFDDDYKSLKDFFKNTGKKDFAAAEKTFNKIKNELETYDGSLGWKSEMKIAGFVEFDYSTGKMIFKDGGVMVSAEASVSEEIPFWWIFYGKFTIGGSVNAKLQLSQENSGILLPNSEFEIAAKPTMAAGIKAASKKIAYIEGGIDGTIGAIVKLPADALSEALNVYLKATCYLKAVIFNKLEAGNWKRDFPKLNLYPNFGSLETEAISENDFKLIDRSYLDYIRTQSLGDINEEAVFPYGNPKLAQLNDGRTIAVFLYDDGTKSDINRATLYYSVLENGDWSVPTAVCNSQFADSPASIYSDGEKVYMVYQRSSVVLEDDSDIETIALHNELLYSEFSGNTWSTPVVIDNDGKYQSSYDLAAANGEVTVIWNEDVEDTFMYFDGTPQLMKKTLFGGTWGETEVVETNSGMADIVAGVNNGNISIAYIVDTDGNFNTENDRVLYIDGTTVSSLQTNCRDLTYQNGRFYWIDGGKLYSYSSGVKNENIAVESDYRIIGNENSTAVVYPVADGFTNELFISYNTAVGYTNPVPLTSFGKFISSYDAIIYEDGNVMFVGNVKNLANEDSVTPYTTTDLVCTTLTHSSFIEVKDVYVEGEEVRGGTVTFNGTVSNTGTNPIDFYSVEIYSENGSKLKEKRFDKSVSIGDSSNFEIEYVIPSTFTKQSVIIKVTAEYNGTAVSDIQEVEIGYADLIIIGESVDENGVVTAMVVNNGCDTANDVAAGISYIGTSDIALGSVNCGSLAPGESADISYTVPDRYLKFVNDYSVNKFKVVGQTSSDETSIANNEVYAIFAPTPVTGVSISSESLTLVIGETTQLGAAVAPDDAHNKKIHWVSDSTDVVKVDENGNITAVGTGTAKITAISDDGGFTAQCEVTVEIRLNSISMDKSSAAMTVGEIMTLVCNFNPDSATNKGIIWNSSDPTKAVVSNDGVVTALATGTTTITATSSEGGFTTSCEIMVTNPVTGIVLSDNEINMYVNQTKQLRATVCPADADNPAVEWESSDSDVASVSSTGLVTSGIAGTAVITATTVDGGFTQSCTIHVCKHVTGIYLSDSIVEAVPGLTYQINATITPLTATNKNVTWVSTNESIARVDSNGFVTAISNGTAYIIAETEDGSYTETCRIIVTNSAAGFALDSRAEYIDIGETVQLTGKFVPEDAENKNISWLSSDETIATVDANGLVKGKKAGSVVITVTTEDGGFRDYCIVRVVGVAPMLETNAYVDASNGYIYGMDVNTKSVDKLLKLTDDSCRIECVSKHSSLGTGSVVNIVRDEEIVDSYTLVVFGDVNGDGLYDTKDAEIVKTIASDKEPTNTSECIYLAADADRDGEITNSDVVLLVNAGKYLDEIPKENYGISDQWKIYSTIIDQTFLASNGEELNLENEPYILNKGDTVQLKLVYRKAKVPAKVNWFSSDKYTAEVDNTGLLKANSFGRTTIFAEDDFGRKYSFNIRVLDGKAHIIIDDNADVKDVKIKWWKKYSSKTICLNAKVYDCSSINVIWESNNKNVYVNALGEVTNTSRRAQSAIITAKVCDPNGDVICKNSVTVRFYKFNWQLKSKIFTNGVESDFFDQLADFFNRVIELLNNLTFLSK